MGMIGFISGTGRVGYKKDLILRSSPKSLNLVHRKGAHMKEMTLIQKQNLRNMMIDFASFEKELIAGFPDAQWEKLQQLRETEFSRLDQQRQAYLDYTGSNLYPVSLVDKFHNRLVRNVYGNPHSENPTANLSSLVIEETRQRVLEYFNAEQDYCCIFTANATASLKLVGESYPFNEKGAYVYTHDNHNSVLGLRQYALDKKAPIEAIYLNNDYCFSRQELEETLEKYPAGGAGQQTVCLPRTIQFNRYQTLPRPD